MAAITSGSIYLVQQAIEGVDSLSKNTSTLSDTLQFGTYLFRGVELIKTAEPVANLLTIVARAIVIMDCLEIINNIAYFAGGDAATDWEDGKFCKVASSSAFSLVTVGGIALLFYENVILGAGVFIIPALGNVIGVAALAGHTFGALNAVQDIRNARNGMQTFKGVVVLVSKVSDVALHILIFVPGASVPAIIVLGITAKGLGLVGYFVEYYNPDSFKKLPYQII